MRRRNASAPTSSRPATTGTRPTLVEVAVIGRDQNAAEDAAAALSPVVTEPWQPATTARNLRLIREAREARGEEAAWIAEIEQALAEKRAQNRRRARPHRRRASVGVAQAAVRGGEPHRRRRHDRRAGARLVGARRLHRRDHQCLDAVAHSGDQSQERLPPAQRFHAMSPSSPARRCRSRCFPSSASRRCRSSSPTPTRAASR